MRRKTLLILLVIICIVIEAQTHGRTVHKRHLLESSNGTRTDTLYQRCPVVRAEFYKSQRNESKSAGRVEVNKAINLNGDAFIYNLLTKNNSGAEQQINKSKGNIVLYVIFLALGLLAMLILTPILIFCCCKPEKCPPCQKIRQPSKQKYTNCQRKWPAIAIIALALVAIGTMIAVLVVNPTLQKGYSETRCSIAMLFDDLLNGNYTQDGQQYWLGLKPLQSKINAIDNSLLTRASSFSDGGQILNQILQNIKSIKHDAADIPTGHNQLFYNSSKQTNDNGTSSSLGEAHQKISKVEHEIVSLSQILNLIETSVPKLRQTFSANIQKYAKLVNTVEDQNKQTDQQMSQVQSKYVSPLLVVTYIIACLIIVASIVIMVASFMICCYDMFNCRKLVYGMCGVLTLLGILCFVLSLLLSAATLTTHYGCNYVETGIQTKQQFVYKFTPIFKDPLLTQLMAECATSEGGGNILQQMLNTNALQSLGPSHQSYNNLTEFDSSHLSQILEESKMHLMEAIQQYRHAQLSEISQNDLIVLQKLSNPALYTCSSQSFSSDSWVPSVDSSNQDVTCKVDSINKVTSQSCPSIGQFQASSNDCIGCIDTFSILSQFQNKQLILDSLNRRYASPDCFVFNQQLVNVWDNFYSKKAQAIKPIEQRAIALEEKIQHLNQQLKSEFSDTINRRIYHLQSIINPFINETNQTSSTTPITPPPSTSIIEASTNQTTITQLNCKVINEDLQLVTQTFCTQIFNYSFSMRVLMIIGGFTLLAIMIFAACLGIRSYRSLQSSDSGSSYKPEDPHTGNKINDPQQFAY